MVRWESVQERGRAKQRRLQLLGPWEVVNGRESAVVRGAATATGVLFLCICATMQVP
jgi:hypothetical protein